MANLAHFWEHLGDLFWILGAILPKIAKTKKTTTVQRFGRFFGVLGLVLEAMLGYLGAMLGYLGAMLGHLGAMLAHLGANLAYVGRSWSHLGAILAQLGDKMGPKSSKTKQDIAWNRQDPRNIVKHKENSNF